MQRLLKMSPISLLIDEMNNESYTLIFIVIILMVLNENPLRN